MYASCDAVTWRQYISWKLNVLYFYH